MRIRPAQVEDVPAVLPMVERICAMHQAMDPAKYGFLPNPSQRYDPWLRQRATDPRSVFLVAEVAEQHSAELVGFLVATVEREIGIYRLKEYGFVHDLWIEEGNRGRGLGRQLTLGAVERFVALGVAQIRLDTAWENTPARRLFERCGFCPSVVEMLKELRGSP